MPKTYKIMISCLNSQLSNKSEAVIDYSRIQVFGADFLWKVSLKIRNLGLNLKAFIHEFHNNVPLPYHGHWMSVLKKIMAIPWDSGSTYWYLSHIEFYPFPMIIHHNCHLLSFLHYILWCPLLQEYEPRSDCSLKRSLIRVHSVCSCDKISLVCIWIYVADMISRLHFLDKNISRIRVKD